MLWIIFKLVSNKDLKSNHHKFSESNIKHDSFLRYLLSYSLYYYLSIWNIKCNCYIGIVSLCKGLSCKRQLIKTYLPEINPSNLIKHFLNRTSSLVLSKCILCNLCPHKKNYLTIVLLVIYIQENINGSKIQPICLSFMALWFF